MARAGRKMAWWSVTALAAASILGITSGVADADPTVRPGRVLGSLIGRHEAARQQSVRVLALGCSGLSIGSGAFVPGGRVITNRHVVAGAYYVEVQRVDGTRIGAAVERVGADVDLAMLWVGAAGGTGATPQGRLDPGVRVRVLGHPGGGRLAEADGKVNARATFDDPGMRSNNAAYLDAKVAAGSSGGPAFDTAGRFVGVVFALENNTGLAAAIDGDTVARFAAGEGASGDPLACEPEPDEG